LHHVGILFPHINDDAPSKSHQTCCTLLITSCRAPHCCFFTHILVLAPRRSKFINTNFRNLNSIAVPSHYIKYWCTLFWG